MKHIKLYYAIDDSGKIDDKYEYSVYAGMLFLNSKTRNDFIGKYARLISRIKCNYCSQSKENCDNNCPEIKKRAD